MKIPRLKWKQMSGCFWVLILCLSISLEMSSAAATAQRGQMAASGNSGQTASPAMCHHLTPAGPPHSHWAAAHHSYRPTPTSDHLHTHAPGNRFFWNPALLLTTTNQINPPLTFRNNEHDSPDSGSFQHQFPFTLKSWLFYSEEQERVQSNKHLQSHCQTNQSI